jgi:hypothetical protein
MCCKQQVLHKHANRSGPHLTRPQPCAKNPNLDTAFYGTSHGEGKGSTWRSTVSEAQQDSKTHKVLNSRA